MTGSRLSTLRQTLHDHGQAHALRFYDELEPAAQAALVDQLSTIDFAALQRLFDAPELPAAGHATHLAPAPFYPSPARFGAAPREAAVAYDPEHYRRLGAELVRAGKVAAFTVAGGQGTRLGWSGPKGTYPATPVTGKPLFRCFAEQIVAAQRKYDTTIPWYIMTSPDNDAETRAFFVDNNCFGLVRQHIFMFPQGVMPCVDAATGKLLLASRGRVGVSPDGHGGSIKALRRSGALEDMSDRGIEQISYFQVDNPLVRVIDPLFIGLHATASDSAGEMSSKVVEKTVPEEKLGVFVSAGDDGAARTAVIEYSELPSTLAAARDASGRLRFSAGSIAVHMLSVAFIGGRSADEWDAALPYHRALKEAPYLDESGSLVTPDAPNAIKFETFVFDALALTPSSIVFETDRVEEFAPIKNARGEDSPATSHRLQVERAARWLETRGVPVPRDAEGGVAAQLEIGPLAALEPADLSEVDLPGTIGAGDCLVI